MPFNPFAASPSPFVGRESELGQLEYELSRPANGLGAVMAGRGMGKTQCSVELERRLKDSTDAPLVLRWPRTPDPGHEFYAKFGRSLGFKFTGVLFVDELIEAVNALNSERCVLLMDEVEPLLVTREGRALLDQIRIAWQELRGRLGVVIFGGSRLSELLRSECSPFLRNAEFIALKGLSLDETTQLVGKAKTLNFDDDEIELLWQETAGHPAVLNRILERAVQRGGSRVLNVLDAEFVGSLEHSFFGIWWDNMRDEGRSLYRKLIEHGQPVERAQVPGLLGGEPSHEWLDVLETTGVVRQEGGEVVPRSELFARWARREHFYKGNCPLALPEHVQVELSCAPEFEQRVCLALTRWLEGVHEYGALGLMLKSETDRRGNSRLMPEEHFQFSALSALQQNGWRVEAEGIANGGRCDIKIEERHAGGARASVELKIWGRNRHEGALEQVLSYAQLHDSFACVVMIDRQRQPLGVRYARMLDQLGCTPVARTCELPGKVPQFITRHERSTGASIRLHHYLLQLPPD